MTSHERQGFPEKVSEKSWPGTPFPKCILSGTPVWRRMAHAIDDQAFDNSQQKGVRTMNTADQISGAMARPGPTWAFLVVGAIFAVGSVIQLFLAGLSTFDTGLYWSDHVFLGRIVSLFALILPVLAIIARLSRPFIVLSAIAAALYIAQVMLTYIDIGPLAALHAINSLPLIAIPALVTLRAWEILRARK